MGRRASSSKKGMADSHQAEAKKQSTPESREKGRLRSKKYRAKKQATPESREKGRLRGIKHRAKQQADPKTRGLEALRSKKYRAKRKANPESHELGLHLGRLRSKKSRAKRKVNPESRELGRQKKKCRANVNVVGGRGNAGNKNNVKFDEQQYRELVLQNSALDYNPDANTVAGHFSVTRVACNGDGKISDYFASVEASFSFVASRKAITATPDVVTATPDVVTSRGIDYLTQDDKDDYADLQRLYLDQQTRTGIGAETPEGMQLRRMVRKARIETRPDLRKKLQRLLRENLHGERYRLLKLLREFDTTPSKFGGVVPTYLTPGMSPSDCEGIQELVELEDHKKNNVQVIEIPESAEDTIASRTEIKIKNENDDNVNAIRISNEPADDNSVSNIKSEN